MQIKCRSMVAEKSVGGPVPLINTPRAGLHRSTPAQCLLQCRAQHSSV